MGMTLRDQTDFALAYSFTEESVALWWELEKLSGLAFAVRIRGNIALRKGDYKLAQHAFAESLAITRITGKRQRVVQALLELGQVTLCLGDHTLAKTYFQQSFELCQEMNNKVWMSDCLHYFGLLAGFECDTQQARNFLEQALVWVCCFGRVWQKADILMGLAGVAAADG